MIFLLVGSFCVQAQPDYNYAVHANIIYHFTKYIDWPRSRKSGDFIIGVTGNKLIYEELKKNISNKMVGDQRIVIKKFLPSANSFDCHILFIGDDESDKIKSIALKTAATSTLLVTESEGLAQKGACINFIILSDRLKLEINKNNIEQRNMRVASELLQLGILIK